jgi:hypothetical protein
MPAASEQQHIRALSQLTLTPMNAADAVAHVASLSETERSELISLADSHHVVVRACGALSTAAKLDGNAELQAWADRAIADEDARIVNALGFLSQVCAELEAAGCPTTVMKSLDHWPDLGNDLDLYTTGDERRVVQTMTTRFEARIEPRSWGDRLAQKWNFAIPGLKEAVEIHIRRLGQTGEHIAMARRFVTRRMARELGGYTFMFPAPEERIIVATLQRMYRHFYFRVCDIVNTAGLVESNELDYAELKKGADLGGIWPGVATYLAIVSDYVQQFRGSALHLPEAVRHAASFGGDKVYLRGKFIRVPIMPHGAELYTRQVTSAALRGDVPATFRLSLLPPLASAAAVAYKFTGSDKGVW